MRVIRAERVSADRLEPALVASRGRAFALALLAFVLGFSLDDLQVYRFPAYLLGLAVSFLLVAFGPLLLARRFARRFSADALPTYLARVARTKRAGHLALLATVLGFVAWLVIFSTGVPPWGA